MPIFIKRTSPAPRTAVEGLELELAAAHRTFQARLDNLGERRRSRLRQLDYQIERLEAIVEENPDRQAYIDARKRERDDLLSLPV